MNMFELSSHTGKQYFPQRRVELIIATARIILTAFFLLAIWLDPSDPSLYARHTYVILAGYLIYSLLLGAMVRRWDSIRGRLQVLFHAIDLMVFAVLMFLTEGSSSPFFVYFVFMVVCATLRWRQRGTLWTAIISLFIVITLAAPSILFHIRDFELNRFIIRIVYLTVVATLLGYLGTLEESMRSILAKLEEWPRTLPAELQTLTREMLEYGADILAAPRMLLVWEEEEEPWLNLALWTRTEWSYSRDQPDAFGILVAGQLAGTVFFCQGAGNPQTTVILNSPSGLQRWKGSPLNRIFQERFAIDTALVARLEGKKLSGYLFVLDKKAMTSDDLTLGVIVANEFTARFDHFLFVKQQQQEVALEERLRLARDLHDGVLQSLTGVALQLETARRLMETEPQKAQQRIQEIQHVLADEQREMRYHINELRQLISGRPAEDFALAARLEESAKRIRQHWDYSVEIKVIPSEPRITRSMAREIYFVVHEALFNAVQHARASALSAELVFETDRVYITVTDDGQGFPFYGRYDLEELSQMKRGPVTLRERISTMGGTLLIDSQQTGTSLEIILPLTEYGV
jgi:signal transduction histidine kinase